MSIFSFIFGNGKHVGDTANTNKDDVRRELDTSKYLFIDAETGTKDHTVHDIGALRHDGAIFHDASIHKFRKFIKQSGADFICGHNIVHHDAKYLFENSHRDFLLVDTLYVSPLLFPERPYHRLVKDDKLMTDQMNNPVNDCEKARELLMDEISCWNLLPDENKRIFSILLGEQEEFCGFLHFVGAKRSEADENPNIDELIKTVYKGRICSNADIGTLADLYPCALSYALALIDTTDHRSTTPGWVLHNYPETEHVIRLLRQTHCKEGCEYCNKEIDVHRNLNQFFGYKSFRTYDGEPLQENATKAAVEGKSLLVIFPTGGGKSLTFQLPALIDGQATHGLTVVISPLQSLMKDQVDNLADRGITDAVTINGLLDPISRSLAIERVLNGDASLLYIAPEMLRSKTIERILTMRNVVRFVIDEAHCFSAWGQDFRVDYLYIGKFIKEYQERKWRKTRIPVSCFTATAKQKVIQDICDYFKHWLDTDLQLFASSATRTNLRYSVIHVDTDNDKYNRLRSLVIEGNCPTIIYVSRTKRTIELAKKLSRDGMPALPYNGKMDADEKIKNQDAFMSDKVQIIVATSAFGMGVDKSDVGLVIHYDISDSLENYVQEAGRAGRDPHLNARCFVLYCDSDLDKHFILLNQTKLSISEIQQVWKAVKSFTKTRPHINCSALEIARQAGWDDSGSDIETRVRTALSALEQSGYIERGTNVPHVFATGITVKNMEEARKRIIDSKLFTGNETENAVRIIKSLISQKNIAKAQDSEAESRIDYLADILGLSKKEVISAVERMRQNGILADTHDLSAYLQDAGESQHKSMQTLERFVKLERFIIEKIPDNTLHISYKQLNDNAVCNGIASSTEKNIRTLLYFMVIKGYAKKKEDGMRNFTVDWQNDMESTIKRFEKRTEICRIIIEWLYGLAKNNEKDIIDDNNIQQEQAKNNGAVNFSVVELLNHIKRNNTFLFSDLKDIQLEDVEEALLYLSKIEALKLEGGFLVLYNAMNIKRLKDTRLQYKKSDYSMLNEFYKQKIQQIHIVGEYANLMVKDYEAALQYVQDYFQMNYKLFVNKYFKGERAAEIEQNITKGKYEQLFGDMSERQREIIGDKESRCIVVAAGPGSGKTKVLVHKLASLLLLEDVKHEQLLMLTFSRAAATEFKQRLMQLIGNAAHFVEIKTFHSYCFDLLGRIGNLNEADEVVKKAAELIRQGEVEQNRIGKTVLVIDEAQDMDKDDYDLITALMEANEEMRVIAVGDDDQNIFEFRGSDSRYMYSLSKTAGGRLMEMTDNYRSAQNIVDAANDFSQRIGQRIKTTPIISTSNEKGHVKVVEHLAYDINQQPIHLYQPILNELTAKRPQGSICILTQTNEEAANMLALLHKHGIKGKLIQSMDGLRFWNMAEARYFTKCIEKGQKTDCPPIIPKELWEEAKGKTFAKYHDSKSISYLKRCINIFEQTNRIKYYSDFKEFLFESCIEDFCDVTDAEVVISTIHKAKGKEYDHVFMLINDIKRPTDDMLRRYYVGMTRTKISLTIHTNSVLFNNIRADEHLLDKNAYSMPEEIILQLSHKDVNLGFFTKHKQEILSLRSGAQLSYHDHKFCNPATGNDIGMLSMKMQDKLHLWESKGYKVKSTSVRFIVAWKPKDAPRDEKETAVILIDMAMKRNTNQNINEAASI